MQAPMMNPYRRSLVALPQNEQQMGNQSQTRNTLQERTYKLASNNKRRKNVPTGKYPYTGQKVLTGKPAKQPPIVYAEERTKDDEGKGTGRQKAGKAETKSKQMPKKKSKQTPKKIRTP